MKNSLLHALNLGRQVVEQEIEALQTLSKSLISHETLEANTFAKDSLKEDSLKNDIPKNAIPFMHAVQAIFDCEGRFIITGMGKSGHIAKKIAATMSSVGTPCFFLHPAEASHGDLGAIGKKDIVLAISNSGESHELTDIMNYVARYNIKLIAITKNQNSALGNAADICLLLPKEAEACPLGCAPTSSTTMTLALGDALAMALLQLRGFNVENFHTFHPGGKLGSSLLHVKDLMHTGEELPLAIVETNKDKIIKSPLMKDVLLEMTQKGFGCIGIVSNNNSNYTLLGIIADGDLRRHMSSDFLEKNVCDVMTKSPTTIKENTLASKALTIMNNKEITSLMVVNEDDKLVGLIHMHDCLRAGL